MFASKPQLAVDMLAGLHAGGVTDAWVAADEVYGGRQTRTAIRELAHRYVIAVKTDHRVSTPTGTFTVTDLVERLPAWSWQRLRTGSGTKGDRHYDWAMIGVLADDTPDSHVSHVSHQAGHSTLLVRRHRYTGTLSFYRCWSAASRPLHELVSVVWRRWRIEEDFQAAKGLTGLDQGQVTGWTSWHRWSLLSMIAYALPAVTTSLEHCGTITDASVELVPISCRELVKLLRLFTLPRPRHHIDPEHALRWSLWRRRHQASSVDGVMKNALQRIRGSRRDSAVSHTRSAGWSRGRAICRRSTATSCRNTRISTPLAPSPRATRTSPTTRFRTIM
jgi:hypothetical protein